MYKNYAFIKTVPEAAVLWSIVAAFGYTVQECDATGDAMKNQCRLHHYLFYSSIISFIVSNTSSALGLLK